MLELGIPGKAWFLHKPRKSSLVERRIFLLLTLKRIINAHVVDEICLK